MIQHEEIRQRSEAPVLCSAGPGGVVPAAKLILYALKKKWNSNGIIKKVYRFQLLHSSSTVLCTVMYIHTCNILPCPQGMYVCRQRI